MLAVLAALSLIAAREDQPQPPSSESVAQEPEVPAPEVTGLTPPEVGAAEPLIADGEETFDYPAVGLLTLGGRVHCTGTLIRPNRILTAAHCVHEARQEDLRFAFVNNANQPNPAATYSIAKMVWPQSEVQGFKWRFEDYSDDIALLTLSGNPSIKPYALHGGSPDWDRLLQQDLLFVGYGFTLDANGNHVGAGRKREGRWRVASQGPRRVTWQETRQSTCGGDSGGPAMVPSGNSYMVVAVTSRGEFRCNMGESVRVAPYQPWLQRYLDPE